MSLVEVSREDAVHERLRNKKPRDDSEPFDNENPSEFEGVSDSGEGEDGGANEGGVNVGVLEECCRVRESSTFEFQNMVEGILIILIFV
jgi:hypothetical protein